MPSDEEGAVEARKAEHLELAARPDVDAAPANAWHDIFFEHEALPECNLDDVDLSVTFLGHRLEAPLVIAGMTGGHRAAEQINAALAAAAGRSGLALGVGSQRAALVNPELSSTYSIVRTVAPSAFIIGNVGIAQLLPQASGPALSLEQLQAAIDMVRADALAVHLNFLEESVQPEGDRHAAGGLAAIERVATALPIPVVVKETGGGISQSTAFRLAGAGAAALDVAGAAGRASPRSRGCARRPATTGGGTGWATACWGGAFPRRCRSSPRAPLGYQSSPPAASAPGWTAPRRWPSGRHWSAWRARCSWRRVMESRPSTPGSIPSCTSCGA